MPRLQPPKGYYTATEVKKILNISDAMVRVHVEKGRIHYIKPLDRKHGFYKKDDVDKLASDIKSFIHPEEDTKTITLTSATKTDVSTCIQLNKVLFAASTEESVASLVDKWAKWIQENPETVYALKENGDVVGIVTVLPCNIKGIGAPVIRAYKEALQKSEAVE